MSLGLEEAGFLPLYVNELNPDAMRSYLGNRSHFRHLYLPQYHSFDIKSELVHKDGQIDGLIEGIRRDRGINARKGELDLLVGGPPCQGYSVIGHRRSYSVDKKQSPSNHLYQDMVLVISRLQPKLFVFENVQGLLYSKWSLYGSKGEIWKDVRRAFAGIPGYQVRHSLVYAKDYGVSQNRPRVLLVGVRENAGIRFNKEEEIDAVNAGLLPKPRGKSPDLIDLLGDLVDPLYMPAGSIKSTNEYPSDAHHKIQRKLRKPGRRGKVLIAGDPLEEHDYSRHSPKIIEKFQYMIDNNGKIPEAMKTKKFSQRVLPERWGGKGPRITVTSMPDDYVHFSQPRILTVREWARLQGFPDWYRFSGNRTVGSVGRAGNPQAGIHSRSLPKYTQIGNAVPVLLAQKVGNHFRKLLGYE